MINEMKTTVRLETEGKVGNEDRRNRNRNKEKWK